MSETATIILPLPPSVLSPNRPCGSRGGRFARAAASKRQRRLACEAVTALRIESGPWERATVQAKFVHVQKRRRDDVNHAAMLKSAYDGVVDAGLLVDDDSEHLTSLPVRFEVGPHPRVEMLFARVE
jgi:hypothetical protein